ncbi:GntR family transcriptional regulator [Microbacterium hydrocarbonoxydans]|uniref:GntR family transcriptional regulator n=1 Tax=Microbacterium hydrocarbonoxydans TaxID=273678 RepID=UPI0013DA9D96|nr:GntR family transcriptional regulator [Microbacterium hydrocarbonoxydans]
MTQHAHVTKQPLSEDVFRHVASRIVVGDLTPGSYIRDVEIAAELHVSRTPVREALLRLERLGMVSIQPSRFTVVTSVTIEEITESMEAAGYYAGALARMAIGRMTAEQRAEAIALVEALGRVLEDPVASASTRIDLLTCLRRHACNRFYQLLSDEWVIVLRRNLRLFVPSADDLDQMRRSCRELQRAMRTGDAEFAERAARALHLIA